MRRSLSLLGLAVLLAVNGWLVTIGLSTDPPVVATDADDPVWLVAAGAGLSTSQGGGAHAAVLALDPSASVLSLPRGSFTEKAGKQPGAIIQQLRARQDLSEYDHILVQGGELDLDAPDGSLRIAVVHLIDYLRAQTGSDTSLTLVGPLPETSAGAPDLQRVNEALRGAAADSAVHYVDAVAERLWSSDPEMPDKLADAVRRVVGEDR